MKQIGAVLEAICTAISWIRTDQTQNSRCAGIIKLIATILVVLRAGRLHMGARYAMGRNNFRHSEWCAAASVPHFSALPHPAKLKTNCSHISLGFHVTKMMPVKFVCRLGRRHWARSGLCSPVYLSRWSQMR
jgi:hypothetical protein